MRAEEEAEAAGGPARARRSVGRRANAGHEMPNGEVRRARPLEMTQSGQVETASKCVLLTARGRVGWREVALEKCQSCAARSFD